MSVKLAPSILDADFGYLAEQVQAAAAGGADWVHVDVMDGMFVPNLTLGPMVVRAIRRATTLPLDVHLMVLEPHHWIAPFRDAGADLLTVHLEADRHPHRTLLAIKDAGVGAGLALNPGTPVLHAVALVELLDLLLIMSVNPGLGGQSFIPRALTRLARAREMLEAENRPDCELEVDGGVKLDNIADVVRAGASVVVAGTAIYGEGAVDVNLHRLRDAVAQP
jgi:ribulose-phosphate 3-epimerase